MNSLRISFLGPSVFKFLSDSLFVRFSCFVGSCYYVALPANPCNSVSILFFDCQDAEPVLL